MALQRGVHADRFHIGRVTIGVMHIHNLVLENDSKNVRLFSEKLLKQELLTRWGTKPSSRSSLPFRPRSSY